MNGDARRWTPALWSFVGSLGKPALFGLLAVVLICTGFLWWVLADDGRTKRLTALIRALRPVGDLPRPELPSGPRRRRR